MKNGLACQINFGHKIWGTVSVMDVLRRDKVVTVYARTATKNFRLSIILTPEICVQKYVDPP